MSDPTIIGPAGVGLRLCSPVRDTTNWQPGVIVGAHHEAGWLVAFESGGHAVVRHRLHGEVALDLTTATGRAHGAWHAMGLDRGHMRPARRISNPWREEAVFVVGRPQDAGWASADIIGHPVGAVVPALASLDPDDDTRLSDGSRVVDARALAIILGATP